MMQSLTNPIFTAIGNNDLGVLRQIVDSDPNALHQSTDSTSALTPIFYAILLNKLDAVKIIIETKPEVLNQENKSGQTPIFYAIHFDRLDAVKTIIKTEPDVLNRENKYGQTPIFYAILLNKLDAVKTIIETEPGVLNQENKHGQTPIFYVINFNKLGAVKKIIETEPEVLEQKNKSEETPILLSLRKYDEESSDENKEILKFIFEKQFQRDLEDEEIKNLVEFVRNYNFLRLFYHQSGQGFFDKDFKSILSSCLPEEEKVDEDLSKKLLKIYQKITSQETPVISLDDGNGLHIHNAQLIGHAAYFIFHVNDKNQLTKISYCDGNKAFLGRGISQIDADGREIPTGYIHGVTTFELKQPQAFDEKFAKEFIEKNSKKKIILELYSQEFSSEKLASKQIFGIEFSTITNSIPTKVQSRGNCASKSNHIISRFLLEQQEKTPLFTFDADLGVQGGAGYAPYKDLRQKMVDNASKKLIESLGKLKEDFVYKIEIFKKIDSLYSRSWRKKSKEKAGTSTTIFLRHQDTKKLYTDNVQKSELFSDVVLERLKQASQQYLKKHFISIFDNNIRFNEDDFRRIDTLLKKIQVDEDFLNHKFRLNDRAANFINFINDHGSVDQKKMCEPHIKAIETRKKQLEGLRNGSGFACLRVNSQSENLVDGVVSASSSPQAPMAKEVAKSPERF